MNQEKFKRRLNITGLLILSIACFFIFKLFNLHFSSRIKITDRRVEQVKRGYIKDKNNYYLAISIEGESLFANPEEVKEPEKTAAILAPLLIENKSNIFSRLNRKKRFVWLKRKLDDDTAAKIKKLNITGLYFRKEFKRVYPHGNLASNILGFVGVDNKGLEGIEYKFNDVLSGINIDENDIGDEKLAAGYNVVLTIDRTIQYISEDFLTEGIKNTGANHGAVIVLEIKTGRILALAKYPTFDPNNYYNYSNFERKSYSVIDSFEPGSTLKIMAVAALLQNKPGIINNEYTCKGKIDVGDVTINCTGEHGKVDIEKIIKYSCNAGIIQAMKHIKRSSYYKLLKQFEFGNILGVELPGESAGILREIKDWSGLSKYSIAIGQEISVTSLQMAAAFSAIANRGIYTYPTIIEAIENNSGRKIQGFFPRTKGRVLDAELSLKILKMMQGVVEGGTGSMARMRYYNVAGKTGTAQKSMKRGGYSPDRVVASFIGVVPVEDPDLCILVIIDEPKGITSGGHLAAPIFLKIAERVLPYRGVKLKRVKSSSPKKIIYKKEKIVNNRMPDLKGMFLPDAVKILLDLQKKYNITYKIIGTGRVESQLPAPSSALSLNQKVIIYLKE